MGFTAVNTYRRVANTSFGTGEHLEYRVHYGVLNAAEATVDVSPSLFAVNERPCYRINVNGRTVGAFDLITSIRNTYQSYIDTSAILPQAFHTSLRENKYQKEEHIFFNHQQNTVRADTYPKHEVFKVPDNSYDFISGYFFSRTLDFNRMTIGQVLELPAFYYGVTYNLKIRYRGRQVLTTKQSRLNVIRLNPVLPDNKLFKAEESIRIYVSDDANKVPIKVEADLWVGSFVMDLRKSSGLRQGLHYF